MSSTNQIMKSCARTVLRPLALARFAAWSSSQYRNPFSASNASPAVLQPAFLRTFFALLAITRGSCVFFAIGSPWTGRVLTFTGHRGSTSDGCNPTTQDVGHGAGFLLPDAQALAAAPGGASGDAGRAGGVRADRAWTAGAGSGHGG